MGTAASQIPGSEWLVGNGEMSEYIRSKDWSETPLGPIESWSPSLRTTVSLALNSTFPISIAWGPQHTQIYNDGYWTICADKHPGSMGQDFTECWASAWPAIGEAFDSALDGRAEYLENQRMFLDRRGFLEETFFTFSFSPILDNYGAVAGLFHPVVETTGQMIAQRRTRALRDLTAGAVTASSLIEGLRLAAASIADASLDVPFALFYEIATDGRSADLVAHTGLPSAGPASPMLLDLRQPGGWPLAEVLRTGEAVLVETVQSLFPGLTCEPYPEPLTSAFLLPITPPGHRGPACVMVAGLSPRQLLTEEYRSFCELLAGGVTTVIANATAITAELRRSTEQSRSDLERAAAIASNDAQLRLITDAVPVLIAHVDADRRYVFNNRAYEDLFGLSRAELQGRPVNEVWAPVMDRAGGYIDEALAGRPVTFDWSLPDGDAPDGGRRELPNATRWFCSSYVPDLRPDGEVRGFFAVTVDVTERIRAEAEIRRLNTDLERRVLERTAELAAANKDLEAFSYSVSHDLRAPLRAIDGFTRFLAEEYLADLPAEAQRYLQLVRGNARSMGNLIDDLLTFSRLGREPVAKAEVDMAGLVGLCLAELRTGYPDNEIRVEVAELPVAHADLALLKQVWMNLLGNAVKYAQKRPVIEITVDSEIVDGEIAYVCRDNGVGFDMRYADKLFGVFERLHRSEEYEGTGVGLAIVEQIVRRHGGRVWAEAELDVGAVFRFTLGEPSRPTVVSAGSVAGVTAVD